MKNNKLRLFLGGDVFNSVGLDCVRSLLPGFLRDNAVDFCVMNGENASLGIGLSASDARILLDAGVDVITGGNHSFEKRDFWPLFDSMSELLRPDNFPPAHVPGRGFAVFEKEGRKWAVLNLQGREDMSPLDCPFRAADAACERLSVTESAFPIPLIIDFHAESSAEKEALGFYLDSRATAVVGTHTHVQTADERILPGGTAYMTDLGMTGATNSVIGVDPALAIKRNITQVLYRMEAAAGPGVLRGLLVDIEPETARATAVERISVTDGI